MIHRRRAIGLVLATVLLVAGCSTPDGASPAASVDPDALDVVATTTVLADLVARVGGPLVRVHSLVPKGGEVHTFDPSPSDLQRVVEADLIVANGLGLDAWLVDVVEQAGADAPIVELGEDLAGVTYLESADGTVNPHVWMNAANAAAYVDRIRDALASAAPGHDAALETRAAAFRDELARVGAEITARFAEIPAERRRVVSFHDAFPYFADAYGLEIVGTVVDAPGQDPSAGEIARLVAVIRSSGARAILSEAQFSDALVRTIAGETGAVVVADLFTDTLGDPPVDSFAGMLTWDADRLLEALAGD